MMDRRRGLMGQAKGGLPSEYQEVEWIESHGTERIYTDIPAVSGISCLAKIAFTSTGYDVTVFGARKAASDRLMLIHGFPSNKWTLGYGSSHTGLGNWSVNTPYIVEAKCLIGEQMLKVDGTTLYTGSDRSDIHNDFNMSIFCSTYDRYDTFALYSSSRIWYLKVFDSSSNLIADFVPCYRRSDNEIGLYDLVANKFFHNSGTGTFSKGGNIN